MRVPGPVPETSRSAASGLSQQQGRVCILNEVADDWRTQRRGVTDLPCGRSAGEEPGRAGDDVRRGPVRAGPRFPSPRRRPRLPVSRRGRRGSERARELPRPHGRMRGRVGASQGSWDGLSGRAASAGSGPASPRPLPQTLLTSRVMKAPARWPCDSSTTTNRAKLLRPRGRGSVRACLTGECHFL